MELLYLMESNVRIWKDGSWSVLRLEERVGCLFHVRLSASGRGFRSLSNCCCRRENNSEENINSYQLIESFPCNVQYVREGSEVSCIQVIFKSSRF